VIFCFFFFFSSRRRHTRFSRDWSSDVCSSDLVVPRHVHDQRLARGQSRVEGERAAIDARVRQRIGDESAEDVAPDPTAQGGPNRSEERRVGKECRARGSQESEKRERKQEKSRD